MLVLIETSMGDILVELWPDKAPATVENFMKYVDDGFYEGLIFHRVIKNFMIQGGGMTMQMKQKETRGPVKNEAAADRPNLAGTIAMARTADVDSATAQFFINLADNGFLDHKDETQAGFGYCAFGQVTEGMDTVKKIGSVRTRNFGPFGDVPIEPVSIIKISRFE
jgi:peptidyl-prolyl cis-trans isomerase B (cyclophilin B)